MCRENTTEIFRDMRQVFAEANAATDGGAVSASGLASPCYMVLLGERQHATVLAALRLLEAMTDSGIEPTGSILAIATDDGRLEKLTTDEIDALCQSINLADPVWSAETSPPITRISFEQFQASRRQVSAEELAVALECSLDDISPRGGFIYATGAGIEQDEDGRYSAIVNRTAFTSQSLIALERIVYHGMWCEADRWEGGAA